MESTIIIEKNRADYKTYLRRLLVIAVPLMLSNVISQVQMIIDRAFLGHVNDLYMSALSNVTAPVWTSMSFCFTIVTGASIIISQKVGAGKKDEIYDYAASMIKWNNVVPLLLFVFWLLFGKPVFEIMGVSDELMPMCMEYLYYFIPMFIILGLEASCVVILQTSNYTKPMVLYGILRAGLNIILDWILIFGRFGIPALGIKGAALATTIAEFVGFIYAFGVVLTNKNLTTFPPIKMILKSRLKPYIESAKLGINTALEDFAWNLGNLIMLRILNDIDIKAAGIYSIVFSVEVLVVVIIGALGQGTMTLSGEAIGKKDKEQFKNVCIIAYGLSFISIVFLTVACIVFPQPIVKIFTTDTGIISACGTYLILVCINLFSRAGNIIVGNGIRGYGDTRWMFLTQIYGTVFVVLMALLFVYVFDLGIVGVFLAVISDEFTRVIINICRYKFIIKKIV